MNVCSVCTCMYVCIQVYVCAVCSHILLSCPFLPILSLQVAQHLAKLFDSMSSLKFKVDESDNPTNEASGMFSKDGEYVDFDKPCHCVGQVSLFVCTYIRFPHLNIHCLTISLPVS